MVPIRVLENLLLCSKYRCILDEDGKPVPPKSAIYKEIGALLPQKMSPKYIYTILLQNRYGLYDKIIDYHNIERSTNNKNDTFTSDDESYNSSSTDKDLEFNLSIPLKTWHDIRCELVIYKSGEKIQRNYNTLRRRRWTNEIFNLIYGQTNLPCALMFKRCKISETGIYAIIYARCPDCKCNFLGKIINLPKENIDVLMKCRLTNFNADIEHTTKRPLSGEKRVEISQSLAAGTLSATTWRRQEAKKVMNLYDSEPPHLYKASTLRKAKQERQDMNLQIKGSCVYTNLQNMKYFNHAGSIHSIGYDPFFIHYWSPEQITIYLEYHDILYIDATGSLIKKLNLPNGELSPHIYLYQAVTNTFEYKMPVFQMLSAVQNVNAIQFWLSEFLRIGLNRKANFPIPRTVVCDFDMALLNAIAKAFGQHSNLKHYLTTCFTLIVQQHTIEKPKCFIRLDICHYIHMISKWKCLLQLNPKVKKFYIRAMAILTKQTNFSQFVELAKCIFILSLSEGIGKNEDGRDSPAEYACTTITHHIKGTEAVLDHDDNDDNDVINDDLDIEIKDCNIGLWSNNLVEECYKTLAENKSEYNAANPYYAPQLSQKLKKLLPYFPLYSGIMIPIFGYGKINASSAAVESEMKDIKHVLLKNISRPLKADKFVTTHISSFIGKSLLAMANNNKSIETDCQTLNVSNIKAENIDSEENDNILDDINELNMEHNWRNKNTPATCKRKTYLDYCPDWDLINSQKSCIGITNLQNGNLCSSVSINNKKVTVINTCGFDSIMCIIACACVHKSYKNIVETSDTDIMRFVKYVLSNGCNQRTYKLRAELLMKITQFRRQIDKNILTIDCFSSIGNIAQYVFNHNPSYIQTKTCNVCSKVIIRQSVIVPINVNVIRNHGFQELSKAILEGMPSNKSVCCNQLMCYNIKYGTQIFIEYNPTDYEMQEKVCLTDFVTNIQLDNNIFTLAGIVARYGDRQNGHFVGYSYQSFQWIEFDDLIRKIKYKTKEFKIIPHLLIYIAYKE